jgi:cell division protein FtsB
MVLRRKLKNRPMNRLERPPMVLLGALLATAYFIAHSVFGTHGLLKKGRLIERSSVLEREIAVLEAVRTRLQRDLAALASEPAHPDMVETLARSTSGFVKPGDLIVLSKR